MFTGYVPIESKNCDKTDPNLDAPCSPPLFRWIKTVAPVQPFATEIDWTPGKNSINVTWKVPASGAGADAYQRQLITKYTVRVLHGDANSVIRTFVLPVDESHPEYFKPAGALIDLNIDGLNATYYEIEVNTTNNAGLSRTQIANANTYITPKNKNKIPTPIAIIIAVVVGILLIVLACGMYHYCIKSDEPTTDDGLKESLVDNATVNSMEVPVSQNSPEFYPPATMRTVDEAAADDAMKRLMNEA